MKKYAVGVCNLYDNVNEVKLVKADNDILAIVLAVGDNEDFAEQFKTIQEVIRHYWDGEIVVSEPVEI